MTTNPDERRHVAVHQRLSDRDRREAASAGEIAMGEIANSERVRDDLGEAPRRHRQLLTERRSHYDAGTVGGDIPLADRFRDHRVGPARHTARSRSECDG